MKNNADRERSMGSDETITGHLLGSLHAAPNGTAMVRLVDSFATDVDDLWSALTEPARLARWIGDVAGDLRVGGSFQARFTSEWEGTGRIEACEPPHRLRVATRSPERAGENVIEATLRADGDRTSLVLEVRGMPLDHVAAYGAGWQVHIEDLNTYLAGRAPVGDLVQRCADLFASYQGLPVGLDQR